MTKVRKLTDSASDLSTKGLFAYCLGFLGFNLGQIGLNMYLQFFWSDIAMISLGAIGAILFISRLIDGASDIAMGFLIDRTDSKYGKARPWLLWMVVPSTISLIFLFYNPQIGFVGKSIFAFITYNAVAFFFFTALSLALQSLTVTITNDSKTRLKLNIWGQAFGTAALVLGNFFAINGIKYFGHGSDISSKGYFFFFGILSVLSGILFFLCFLGTKEKKRSMPNSAQGKEKIKFTTGIKLLFSNKYWIIVTTLQISSYLYPAFMSVSLYYMIWIMKDAALMGPFMSINFVSMFLALLVLTPISRKLNKITMAYIGLSIQTIGCLITLANPTSIPLLIISSIMRGVGPAALFGTRLAFTSDVVEYGEWKTGVRTEGLIFSGASVGQKVGQGLGGAIVALILSLGGYIGGAASQTTSAISAINLNFTWMSGLACLIGAGCLFFMRNLEKQIPQIMNDLEIRKT